MLKNIRIFFSKTGRAKYISHLDLTRTMARAVRRAAIPLWYTEGFNRHPYLTFAAPLSLGHEGLRETMDLRLEEEMGMAELVCRLDAVMPEGLHILSAAEAVAKPGDLAAAEYRMTLFCPIAKVREALALPELNVEKITKKKTTKAIDIRPFFAEAGVEEEGECTVVRVTLPCGSSENINPALLVTALNRLYGETYRCDIVRLRVLQANGKEFA